VIQSRRFSWHCQILVLFLLRSFALFIAPDGITGFGIAQFRHCNVVFCSFVLRIDWLKPFLSDHAITYGINGLNSFKCLWCNTTIVNIGRKVRFHHKLPFTTKQRCSSAAATSRLHQKFGTGLPLWLFWGQICNFWLFFNSFGFFLFLKKGQMKFGFFLAFFGELDFLCRFGRS